MSERLDVDYSERTGFLTGKSAALAEWRHRKDSKDFAKLVAVLRACKWQREHPERARETKRNWHRRHAAEANARQRERDRKAPRERACDVCGTVFALPFPHPRGSVKKRCSADCDRAAANRCARKGATRIRPATRCSACGGEGHNRRTCTSVGVERDAEVA